MAIVDVTDWKFFLSPNSDLPPDVSFLVADGEDSSKGSKTIRAHKYFLGAVSPVFRKQFFGPMKNEREVIDMVDITTAEAFQTMIDFIYKPPGQDTFTMDSVKCAKTHFDVFALADYYQVLGLCEHVKKALKKFDVTGENFVTAVTVAMTCRDQFEDFSYLLSLGCFKFLQDITDDMSALVEDTLNRFPGASRDILLELQRVKDDKLPGNANKIES